MSRSMYRGRVHVPVAVRVLCLCGVRGRDVATPVRRWCSVLTIQEAPVMLSRRRAEHHATPNVPVLVTGAGRAVCWRFLWASLRGCRQLGRLRMARRIRGPSERLTAPEAKGRVLLMVVTTGSNATSRRAGQRGVVWEVSGFGFASFASRLCATTLSACRPQRRRKRDQRRSGQRPALLRCLNRHRASRGPNVRSGCGTHLHHRCEPPVGHVPTAGASRVDCRGPATATFVLQGRVRVLVRARRSLVWHSRLQRGVSQRAVETLLRVCALQR